MGGFQSLTRQPEVSFQTERVGPPSPLYIGPEDLLLLYIWNSASGATIDVATRILGSDGRVMPSRFRLTPTTDRALSSGSYPLSEGYLLSVVLALSAGSPVRGQTFCSVMLQRNSATAGITEAHLVRGYLSVADRLAWPGMANEGIFSGHGVIRSITGTDQAAGAEISETVPTNALWRLMALRASLVSDATAVNRTVHLRIDDGTNALLDVHPQGLQPASLTVTYSYSHGLANTSDGGTGLSQPIPEDLYLPAGYRITTSTGGLQAGDNWGAPQLLVEEWLQL